MAKKIFIGVDFGGTKIMTGAIDDTGKVLGTPVKVYTGANDEPSVIIKRITESIEKIMTILNVPVTNIGGIGIGATGPLDLEKGTILECPQLPTLQFFPLQDTIQKYFNIPVYLNNDANCLILAECVFGVAICKKNIAGFTLGTGIGCAVIIDKKIFNGATGSAGEIWPSHYQSGIIEDFISGGGVQKIYKSVCGESKSSLDIYRLAVDKDLNALKTWKIFGEHLAVPISWTINLLDPEIVVLGGSISAAYPFFKASMEKKISRYVCPVPASKTKVVLAALGDHAGFIGAACLAIQNN
ncbi:MAG: ROK family protein [Ginsengibacter sp.]